MTFFSKQTKLMEILQKMPENLKSSTVASNGGQCQFFVLRKKRLCRMTVRPGRQYCGEHEPKPITDDGQVDTRIPCPNDPKHTCYASKLEKHLTICNARKTENPPYIIENINAPAQPQCDRIPLVNVDRSVILTVVEKVERLYEEHIQGNISSFSPPNVHQAVVEEMSLSSRTHSSKRHLSQASALLMLAEHCGLVRGGTCYVELGAGKGQLSYYMGENWCQDNSSIVISIDRAALRHKRDNKLSDSVSKARIRADLRDLALHRLDGVVKAQYVVGVAKHLCGVATDYALRCMTGDETVKSGGVVMATCCHHRCEQHSCLAAPKLQELGITPEEFNVILGIVSWATCGDGRSRDTRKTQQKDKQNENNTELNISVQNINEDSISKGDITNNHRVSKDHENDDLLKGNISQEHKDQVGSKDQKISEYANITLTQEQREQIGRKAKTLIDWGRVLYLRDKGFDAKLCYYVPVTVSLENLCIVATKH